MNKLEGTIENITTSESLSIIYVKVNDLKITAIVIDTPETNNLLKIGNTLNVVFKETEVIIGKGIHHQISMQNKFIGIISAVESKELLSKVSISTSIGTINSIITTNAVKQLELNIGSEVTAMIKTNEILLTEC